MLGRFRLNLWSFRMRLRSLRGIIAMPDKLLDLSEEGWMPKFVCMSCLDWSRELQIATEGSGTTTSERVGGGEGGWF